MAKNLRNVALLIITVAIIGLVGYHRFKKSAQGAKEVVTDKVTFEITLGDEVLGEVELGLFGRKAPRTVENFLAFAGPGVNGYKYEGSIFHRVIKSFMIQGGDVVNGDGTGSISKFGETFADELPSHKHSVEGLLSMANSGRNTNGSQFFITTVPTHWLDGKHVVFGKVLNSKSMDIIRVIENTEVDGSTPLKTIRITKSTVQRLPASGRFPTDIEEEDECRSPLRRTRRSITIM